MLLVDVNQILSYCCTGHVQPDKYVGLHAKCPISLSDFNNTWTLSTQRKMEICSEFLKEEYEDLSTVLLTTTVYGEQDVMVNFISFTLNQIQLKRSRQEDRGGWDTSLECKNWILAESSLYLKQKALDV